MSDTLVSFGEDIVTNSCYAFFLSIVSWCLLTAHIVFVPAQLFDLFSKVYQKDHGRESLLLEYARYMMKNGRNKAPSVCRNDSKKQRVYSSWTLPTNPTTNHERRVSFVIICTREFEYMFLKEQRI